MADRTSQPQVREYLRVKGKLTDLRDQPCGYQKSAGRGCGQWQPSAEEDRAPSSGIRPCRSFQPEDEEDEEPALEELEQREVLVLGLDGSGKSTFLRVLSGKPPLEGHIPTWGFNSVRLPTKDFEVDLLEIGGSQNLRFYWKEFVNEVDVLVFMVDSADRLRLPWARQELHKLLDKDPDLPVVVVANKQDLSEAMSMVELQQELGLQAINSQREVFLVAASIAPAGPGFEDPGSVQIWKLLLELLS
nr:PREDICTED: ADP-ribosylation factor-like protein 10 [Equus przewalskii]